MDGVTLAYIREVTVDVSDEILEQNYEKAKGDPVYGPAMKALLEERKQVAALREKYPPAGAGTNDVEAAAEDL